MEFKKPQKKRVSFQEHSSNLPNNKKVNWFDDDDDWLDSVYKVDFNKPEKGLYKSIKKISKNTLNKVKQTIHFLNHKNKRVVVFSVISALTLFSLLLNNLIFEKNSTKEVAGSSVELRKPGEDLPREKPSFKILYPGAKTAETVGEIVKVSPPNTAPVYTFVDKIRDIQINISQQELPDNFKINQDGELQKLAENFQANNVIQVDSVKVYHGSSASGVQSLIFIKGNILFTIRASQKIQDETWAAYISALHL